MAENSIDGTGVGSVSASDPNSGDTLTYSLGGGPFTIDASTGAITVNGPINFESTPSYSLSVTVTDSGGLSDTVTVEIIVTNVNERPNLTLGTVSPTVEGSSTFSISGTVQDPDSGDSRTVVIDWGDLGDPTTLVGSFVQRQPCLPRRSRR